MAAVWPAGPEPIMTSLECIARDGGVVVAVTGAKDNVAGDVVLLGL